jgi:hypothetical protein
MHHSVQPEIIFLVIIQILSKQEEHNTVVSKI